VLQQFSKVLTVLVLAAAAIAASRTYAYKGVDAASTADRDATLDRHIESYPNTLNPIIYSLAVENEIIGQFTIYEYLVDTHPDTGEPECWLCTTFAYDPNDKKIATFTLRDDVMFHDGKKMTAEDVAFSYEVLVHPKVDNLNIKSDVAAAIKSIEAVNPTTLKVTFNDVKYSNIYQLGLIPVIPKHLFPYFASKPEDFNKDQKFGRNPLGTGPYKFKKWQAGKSVELERNEDWWGFKSKDPRFANTFNFKKIRYKIVTDDNVAFQAFQKGEFDFMDLQSFQYEELTKNAATMPKVEPKHLRPKVGTSWAFIAWNGRLPIFQDVKTRHALSLLTDRFSTLQKFSKGLRPPTNGPWGIDSPYSCAVKDCPIVPFDTKAAQKLLAEAGWADTDKDGVLDRTVNGEKQVLKFTILAGQGDYYRDVTSVYVTEMKKNGIDVDLRQLDWSAMIKLIDDLNFQAYFSGFRNGYPILPRQLFHSANVGKTGSNTWNYVDAESDKLIDTFEKEFDAEKRMAISRELHKRIYDSHAINWHHEGGGCYVGRNKELQGLEVADFRPSCIYWPRWYKTKTAPKS
jgi:ABC-type transport system substrate-binding protein